MIDTYSIFCLVRRNVQKSEFIWMDGKYLNWDDAKISVMTHTLHYGTGVFEGIRARETSVGTAIFRLQDHIERLFSSAEAYNLDIPYSYDEIFDASKLIVFKNKLKDAYIRPLVFFGNGEMGLLPNAPVQVAISAWSWAPIFNEAIDKGVRVCLSPWQRISPKSFKPYAKGVGGYMNSTLAKIDAVNRGYDDALMLSDNGNVAEGSGQNIFIVKNNEILTPPVETGALNGITKKTVVQIAKDLDLKISEVNIMKKDLFEADELFFTGTATEVVSVVSVDETSISDGTPGEITKAIRSEYMGIVLGRNKKYINWLTRVDL